MSRITTTLLGTAVALALPLALAAPAQAVNSATYTDDGCTILAKWPKADGTNGAGVTMVAYTLEITCDAGREVEVDQQVWEQDLITREGTAPDTFVHQRALFTKNFAVAGTKVSTLRLALPDADLNDPIEEVYQSVSFEVTTTGPGPVSGGWTPRFLTQARGIQ